MTAFGQGLVAGYAIAIPVGAIAILIMNAALRRGFRIGFMAGAGAATADLIFASAAAFAGAALAEIIAPLEVPLRILSGMVLIGLGGWGLWKLRASLRARVQNDPPQVDTAHGGLRTYQQFLALTLLNPATIAYFASLILGGGASVSTALERVLFVLGAWLSSLSWQTLLAVFGALAHRRLSPRMQAAVSILGNVMIIGLGANILI